MNDERIEQAFEKLREAWALLEQVRDDESVDFTARYICTKCALFVRQIGNELVNLVSGKEE